jgi:hypothetical protein
MCNKNYLPPLLMVFTQASLESCTTRPGSENIQPKEIQQTITKTPLLFSELPTLEPTLAISKDGHSRDYWPTEDWRTSTPEEQDGTDSRKLNQRVEYIYEMGIPIYFGLSTVEK